jgi:hypothetical protein
MMKRVKKVLVAKSINRTSALTSATLYTGTNGPAAGEAIVLDKNRQILAAGSTVADSDTIYIAVATAETYDVTNEAGTTVTGIRKLLLSDPIEAKNIKNYTGKSYTAPTECSSVITTTGYTPVAGDSYVVRIVYKDIPEHPGQFTYTYRTVSSSATLATLMTEMAATINGHTGRRVTATAGATSLTLTAKVVLDASSNATVSAIDTYRQVNFEVFFWRVIETAGTTLGNKVELTWTQALTGPNPGAGQAKIVRDEEKLALSHRGITNQWYFPVIKPDLLVDMSATYDTIIIESDKSYLAADNQYVKTQPLSTLLYIPAAAGQATDILAVLNPWMESAGFSSITI